MGVDLRQPRATPDRHARLVLAALVLAALAMFGWLVVTLADAAFRA